MRHPTLDSLADQLGLSPGSLVARADGTGSPAIGRLDHSEGTWFTKSAPSTRAAPLHAEADGLAWLAQSGCLRVPEVVGIHDAEGTTWLILEWLELRPQGDRAAQRLGERLAEHHRCAIAEQHGLDRDNWIGATPQSNSPTADWTRFLFEHRLGAMIDRLAAAGIAFAPDTLQRLREVWTTEFSDYRPAPSLLHGDLWGGNAGELPGDAPVVFDPAVHYGDRECDLAMASLFGGFPSPFHEAYRSTWPLDPGWELRRAFYQIYHVLNHALLFGGAYIDEARRRVARLAGDTA